MEANRKPVPGGNFIAPLLYFSLTAIVAALLIIWAFVMWLAELTGSIAAAALIAGAFFTLLAWVIYLLNVRHALEELHQRTKTLCEVAYHINNGYNWFSTRFPFISFLHRSK